MLVMENPKQEEKQTLLSGADGRDSTDIADVSCFDEPNFRLS